MKFNIQNCLAIIGVICLVIVAGSFLRLEYVTIGVCYTEPSSEEEVEYVIRNSIKELNWHGLTQFSKYRFNYHLEQVPMMDAVPLNVTQFLHAQGINFFVGFDYSDQCGSVLEYCSDNDILLISPSSSSDDLSYEKGNLYRLKCVDSFQGNVIRKTLEEYDITNLYILKYDAIWSSQIVSSIESENHNINIVEMSYNADDVNNQKYPAILSAINIEMDNSNWNLNQTGVLHIGMLEISDIVEHIEPNSTLANVLWFGTQVVTSEMVSEMLINFNNSMFSKIKLISPSQTSEIRPNHEDLTNDYEILFGRKISFVQCARYDAVQLLGRSIVNLDSTVFSVVSNAVSQTGSSYKGMTGLCVFNNNNDRVSCNYDVYAFDSDTGKLVQSVVAFYNATSETLSLCLQESIK